ncbi:MAG: acetamidase [Actinobacteria bacterium]|nr:acetamidase [Actinomycetota bacterium]
MKSPHHNRWHPAIEPALRTSPGRVVTLHVPDGASGQVTADAIRAGKRDIDLDKVHPLVGPIYVEGVRPGDVLEVEILRIGTHDFGWTGIFPMSGGLLSDMVEESVLAGWDLSTTGARTELLPGIEVPRRPNVGVVGVAPSLELLDVIAEREDRLSKEGGWIQRPSPGGALPDSEPSASKGLRTLAAREIGGNLDIPELGEGCTVLLPVHVDGALFSLGDVHFSQGDGECFGTGIETSAEIDVRFHVRQDPTWKAPFPALISKRKLQANERITTTGLSLDAYQDVGIALREAVSSMIEYLKAEQGLSLLQAQLLISVCASLSVSVVNNPPSPVVTASLPLELFRPS